MARPAKDPMEKIKKDVEKKYETAMKELAEEVSFRIEAAYESVISKFYSDYTPRYYERTLMTYEASDHAEDPFGYSPIVGGYAAGISVGPENIPGNPYRADKDWVFERTFERGIHVEYDNKKRLEDFELKLMTDFAIGGGVFYKGKRVKKFEDVKKLVNFNYLKPNTKYGVKRTSPVPRSRMNQAFKIIAAPKNLKKLSEEILAKNFK